MMLINDYAPLLLRLCLVVLFPFSALDKIMNWDGAMKQAGSLPAKPVMLVASIVVELVTPVCIVTGWNDRLAAFVLAGFCVITAVLFHQFWRFPDFWRFKEGPGLAHFWDFLKNFGLVGGLRLVMLSPRTLPVSDCRAGSACVHHRGWSSGRPPGALIDQHQTVAVRITYGANPVAIQAIA